MAPMTIRTMPMVPRIGMWMMNPTTRSMSPRMIMMSPWVEWRGRKSAADRVAVAEAEPEQQHDHRSDEGSDDSGGLQEAVLGVLVEDQVAEESADERSDDAQHDGHPDGDVLPAGHNQARKRAGDQPDDDDADDETEHVLP